MADQPKEDPPPLHASLLQDDGVPRFRCVDCKQRMPVEYLAPETPYGQEGPVCVMCLSYWEYLAGPEELYDPEEDSQEDAEWIDPR